MKDALAIGGAALVLYLLIRRPPPPRNPNTVNPRTSMTTSGQDTTVYGPGAVTDGVYRGRPYDSAAAKAAAKAFAAQPVTSKLSYFRAVTAQSAQTPPAPAPVPDAVLAHYVRGTMAVTQIT